MTKGSTQRLLSIFGSFALIILTAYVYSSLLQPAFADVQQLKGERQARASLADQYEKAAVEVKRLIAEYQNSVELEEAFSETLPKSNPDMPAILNQLNGIANLSGLVMESVSFQLRPIKRTGSQIVNGLGTVRTTLRLSGSYEDLKEYIDLLEHNVRVMDVGALKIEGGATPGRSSYNYNLVVDIYYQEK